MTPGDRTRLRKLFDEAVRLPLREREAFLNRACGSDVALRRELERLLAAEAQHPLPIDSASERSGGAVEAGSPPASLAAGSRLGPYVMQGLLGAGGMGEVYRATDTRLRRDVAIKIMPAALARDTEWTARFQRESRVLASLNHPHISAIYGVEQEGDTQALVLELVEGPTLADRIRQGPLPVEEALAIARQIAEALEYAHEKGIVHRDLKPANVKLTTRGDVKVLDFGLAKAMDVSPPGQAFAHLATISSPASRTGVILGTAAYMSPEQARGRGVDRRTDIWALGCVIYELLTGTRAFPGDNVSDLIANVLQAEPDWSALPAATPPRIALLLRRCLVKDPTRRLRDAGDVAIELSDTDTSGALAAPVHPGPPPRGWRGYVPLAGALLLGGLIGAGLWDRASNQPQLPVPVTRLAVPIGPGFRFSDPIALSPDGTMLAFMAVHDGARRIFVRDLNSFDSTPLIGTAPGVNALFFSPDSRWVGFSQDSFVQKVSPGTGAVVRIAGLGTECCLYGGAWAEDGTLFYAGPGPAVQRIEPSGSEPLLLPGSQPDGIVGLQWWPEPLPGGDWLLLTGYVSSTNEPGIFVRSLTTGETRLLVESGMGGRYVEGGYLVYARAGRLFAVRFDAKGGRVLGSPVPVVDGVFTSMWQFGPPFAVSRTGTLAYVPGSERTQHSQLAWIDRSGRETVLPAPVRGYRSLNLSPDGGRVAVGMDDGSVWQYDVAHNVLSRVARPDSPEPHSVPLWSPDGTRIAFLSTGDGTIAVQRADGSGTPEPLARFDHLGYPLSWRQDTLALVEYGRHVSDRISLLRLGQPPTTVPFVSGKQPSISPNGKWLAYTFGADEIAIQDLAGSRALVRVSRGGGIEPRWRADGKELFYRRGGQFFAVTISEQGDGIVAGDPRALFETELNTFLAVNRAYDVTPDGQRFLVMKRVEPPPTQINVVLGWLDELRQRVP
jgi:eukaryotic-like serine/threonine-protein kinase